MKGVMIMVVHKCYTQGGNSGVPESAISPLVGLAKVVPAQVSVVVLASHRLRCPN